MSLQPKEVDFDVIWPELENAIEEIITLGQVARPIWNDRLNDVYELCVAFPEPLGDKLYQKTKHYLDNHVKHLFEEVRSSDDLLVVYHKHWSKYSKGIDYLNQLFLHLNTLHIEKQKKFSEVDFRYGIASQNELMLEIGELGLELWKQNVIEALGENLIHLLSEGIKNDRLGDSANQPMFHDVIQSLVQAEKYKRNPLQLYRELFEIPFLLNTGEYYRLEASKLLQETNCSQYMEKALLRIDEEKLRSRKYLHPTSYPKVIQECEQRLITDHLQFLHGQCKQMVQHERQRDLHHMYLLLKSIPNGLDALITEIQEHITKIGLEITNSLKGENIPQLFVKSVIQFHGRYYNLIKAVFNVDQQFIDVLDKACAAVVNFKSNPTMACKSSEWLVKYYDSLLRKSAKSISESEIEDKLSQSITVFKYIDDKDVFQMLYAKMLAKRLIFGQSVSMDAEEAMINKLKLACGYGFTSKLHHMFTDKSVSVDLNEKFATSLRSENTDLGISCSFIVLQTVVWPLTQSAVSPFVIPQELEKSVQKFEIFYNTKFSGRKLTWLHHLCNAKLKLCYLRKPYIVTMNTYQMALLLLYEGTDSVSYNEMKNNTNLNDELLSIQIKSLIESKLILTDTDCKEVATCSSVFRLNKEYSNKRTKFKLPAAIQKETSQQEIKQTYVSVEGDRKMCLQAAIVRIMKARKVLLYNTVIQEVINQLKGHFVPDITLIKSAIDVLIDKQYLEQSTSCADEYRYIA